MRKQTIGYAIAVSVLAVRSSACANSGTPLMLVGVLQLYGGNLLIALLESWIILRFFKAARKRGSVFGIIVLANYFSLMVGLIALPLLGRFVTEHIAHSDALYMLPKSIISMFLVAYVVTLVLEWPFCLWAIGQREHRLSQSFKAVLTAQTVSHAILLPLVLCASGLTLLTRTKITPTVVAQAPDVAAVYFLSNDDDGLWRVRLNGTRLTRVLDVRQEDRWRRDRLFLARRQGGKWGLWIAPVVGGPRLLLDGVADAGGLAWSSTAVIEGIDEGGPYGFFCPAAGLQPDDRRVWHVSTDPFPVWGLIATNGRTGESLKIALDTPFARWGADNPSLLPGNRVVYELGNQIVLLDLNTMRVGLIAMGRQPVVVLDDAVAREATRDPSPEGDGGRPSGKVKSSVKSR